MSFSISSVRRMMCLGLGLCLALSLGACSRRKTRETEAVTYGMDVSRFQGTVDFAAARDSGVQFVMVRLGYRSAATGEIARDSNAAYNMQSIRDAGLPMGVYFFSAALSPEEAQEEADWVLAEIARYPITYPVVYDCEGFLDSESRQYGLSAAQRTDNALAFLEAVEKAGYEGMFYASKSELLEQWETDRIAADYKIWIAQYPSLPYPQTLTPSYDGAYSMWQYTHEGSVPGVSQPVDLNIAMFGYDGIEPAKDKTPPEPASPDPEALMEFRELTPETVTAKIRVNLRQVPSQEDDGVILDTLENGQTAIRTGISDSGWSRLLCNDTVCYAVSSYLTGDLSYNPDSAQPESDTGIKTQFEPMDDRITPKEKVNLRTLPSVEDPKCEIAATILAGTVVHRTGINRDVGWSRVEYNGQTLYCITQYMKEAEN